jgi:GNAT superfamily N-acetyltransferase
MEEIRRIEYGELGQLAGILGQLTGTPPKLADMDKVYAAINSDPNYYLLGAFREGRLAGTIMAIVCYDLVNLCRPFMVIENVVVDEKCRGLGIGAALVGRAEELAMSRSCAYTMLVSGMKRKDAHQFYEAMGYAPDRVRGFKKEFV